MFILKIYAELLVTQILLKDFVLNKKVLSTNHSIQYIQLIELNFF